jgi:hypothetical protein
LPFNKETPKIANINHIINMTITTLKIPAVDFIKEIIITFRVSKWVKNLKGHNTLIILIIVRKFEFVLLKNKSTILKITIVKSNLDHGS